MSIGQLVSHWNLISAKNSMMFSASSSKRIVNEYYINKWMKLRPIINLLKVSLTHF